MTRTNVYNYHFTSYREIRNVYTAQKKTENLIREEFDPDENFNRYMKALWDDFKVAARTFYHRTVYDQLSVPIREGWRSAFDSDGEGGTDYTIISDEGQTDEEIAEIMYDSPVYLGRINSPYDCTGKRFTRYWTYRRVPCGIVLIHEWGLDI